MTCKETTGAAGSVYQIDVDNEKAASAAAGIAGAEHGVRRGDLQGVRGAQ